ncbi:peptidoglycan-binding domain-containing protein [Fulvitalea axinellae]|uniref:peptidoglycan-binding domain-containing protein n=1 Tax=Fulvitalea axinellae TaxID=1182444 RepID=UPI0030CA36D7
MGQFEDVLKEAGNVGIVNRVPEDGNETFNYERQRIRLHTIASRLWLLGYLEDKIPHKQIPKRLDKIKQAVEEFQADAGLESDHWVGDKTWGALDQLVSFESDIDYEQWFDENGLVLTTVWRAMHRAFHLRLFTLGLLWRKPHPDSDLMSQRAFDFFNDVKRIFLMPKKNVPAGYDIGTARLLFDQDFLSETIAKRKNADGSGFLLDLPEVNKKESRVLAQRFITNCAKIELWLLGFDVDIDGKDDFGKGNRKLLKCSKTRKALTLYFQKFEGIKRRSEARKLSKQITPAFFKGVSEANSEGYEADQDDLSEEILKKFRREPKNFVSKAWTYIKEKGMRLLDGFKRIWRWIKKKSKQLFSFIQDNIFKAFFRYASKSYRILSEGITAVAKSIGIYIRGRMEVDGVVFGFSKDMDTVTFIPETATAETVLLASGKVLRQSKAFSVACRMVGFVFRLFKRAVAGVIGWAKLLYDLLRSFGTLKTLYRDFVSLAT